MWGNVRERSGQDRDPPKRLRAGERWDLPWAFRSADLLVTSDAADRPSWSDKTRGKMNAYTQISMGAPPPHPRVNLGMNEEMHRQSENQSEMSNREEERDIMEQ
jgi:hypothetical protein